jgi:cyclic beta-1,2-glucan synthetase
LGSAQNDECQIDSIAQSWSILTGGGSPERARTALNSVLKRLVRRDINIICLLDPPFDQGTLDPGYIKGYLPGVRENGGQYTHAATWVVMATAALGMGDTAYELFQMINPINHGRSAEAVRQYQGEPYVTCGDVYSVHPHEGRAGWSWYTGSGAWLYRIGLESIIGLSVHPTYFVVDPCIPAAWDSFSVNYTHGLTTYVVTVKNPDGVEKGVRRVSVDGVTAESKQIVFDLNQTDRRTVFVEVLMG